MTLREKRTHATSLPPREPRVPDLLAEACGAEEIASELSITRNAVHRHKGDLMEIRLFLETLDFSP
jgi:DNA-binding NarL/FixJ family response regulator